MKFPIDFHYPINYVPFRQRLVERRYGSAQTELEICELQDSDAPVAMRIAGDAGHHAGKRFARKDDGSLRDVRHRDGRFYVETMDVDQLKSAMADPLKFETETLFRACDPIQKTLLDASPVSGKSSLTTIDRIRSSQRYGQPIQEEKTDVGLEKMEADLKYVASQTFIVDGKVFELCPEPVIMISSKPDGSSHCSITTRPYDAVGSLQTNSQLSGEIYDIASRRGGKSVAFASLRDAVSLMMELPDDAVPEYELLLEETSVFDGATYDVMSKTGALVSELRQHVSTMRRDELEAFFELRDAFAGAERGMRQVTGRLVDAVVGYSELPCDEDDTHRDKVAAAFRTIARKSFGGRTHNFVHNASMVPGRSAADRSVHVSVASEIVARWESRNKATTVNDGLLWNGGVVKDGVRTFEIYSEDAAAALSEGCGLDRSVLLERFRQGETIIGIVDYERHAEKYAFAARSPSRGWGVADSHCIADTRGVDLQSLLELHFDVDEQQHSPAPGV